MEMHVNYWAVVVAAVATFAIGALWYAPFLFGKAWQSATGLTDDELKNANMGRTFGLSFILNIIIAYGMAMFFAGEADLHKGAMWGMMTGLFFVIPSMGTNSLFEQHSLKLFLVNAGYNLVTYTVLGAIIGAWQ